MLNIARFCALSGASTLFLLAACATPQQRCIAQATADTRALEAQIKTTEATIERGYALHRQSIPYTQTRVCYDKKRRPFPCNRTRFHPLETPVTVDLGQERAKLAQMKAKLAKLKPKAVATTEACRRSYRE